MFLDDCTILNVVFVIFLKAFFARYKKTKKFATEINMKGTPRIHAT